MVETKSTINYEQYKKELYDEVMEKHGEQYAEKLISFISDRYDCVNRVYLDKNLMFVLRDDYSKIVNGNIVIFLIVGLGNVGKTTLAKNIAYYMDKRFRNDFLCWGFEDFVKKLESTVDETERSYLIDEPNDVPNSQSREGVALREIIGQLRQQKMFLILCSTDFKDIPPTVIRKVTTLIYLNKQGHGYLIRDRPALNEYPLHTFKKDYIKEGYGCISKILKKFHFLQTSTHADNILSQMDVEGEKSYLKEKKKMLKGSLKKYVHVKKTSTGMRALLKDDERDARNREILRLKKKGFSHEKVAAIVECNKNTVTSVMAKFSI